MRSSLKILGKRYFLIYALLFLCFTFARGFQALPRIDYLWLFAAFLLNIVFALCKTASLYLAVRAIVPVRFPFIIRSFLKSVTVSIVTFTSKAGFLTALFFQLSGGMQKKESAQTMALFVTANLLGLVVFVPLFLPLPFFDQISTAGALFLISALSLVLYFKRKSAFLLLMLAMMSYLVNNLQISLIAHAFGVPFSLEFFKTVIVAEVARVISHIPFGMGVTDGIFYLHFKADPTILNFPLFLITIRLFGELLTAFWGFCVMAAETIMEQNHRDDPHP